MYRMKNPIFRYPVFQLTNGRQLKDRIRKWDFLNSYFVKTLAINFLIQRQTFYSYSSESSLQIHPRNQDQIPHPLV